jgi:S1-C subfamily serine protease
MTPWSCTRTIPLGLLAAVVPLAAGGLAYAQTSSSTPAPSYTLGVVATMTPAGMVVNSVTPGSPGASVGLIPGDLLLKVDDRAIQGPADLKQGLDGSGGVVRLVVHRRTTGQVERVTVNLLGGPLVSPYLLGVRGRYTAQGMLLTEVGTEMPASRVGLRPGDLLARINGELITSQDALFGALYDSDGEVDLTIRPGGVGPLVKRHVALQPYQLGALGDFTPQGIVLGIVAPQTPAAWVGLRRGDIILTVDGKFIASQKAFLVALNRSGGTVTLMVRRGPTPPARLEVNLMNSPLGGWSEPAADGLRMAALHDNAPAARAGLRRGDVILRVGDQPVRKQSDLLKALDRAHGQVNLEVRQAQTGRVVQLSVNLSRRPKGAPAPK